MDRDRTTLDVLVALSVGAILVLGVGLAWQTYRQTQAHGEMMGHTAIHGPQPLWYPFRAILIASVVAGAYWLVRDQLTDTEDAGPLTPHSAPPEPDGAGDRIGVTRSETTGTLCFYCPNGIGPSMAITHDGLAVSWLGYATARIEAPDGTVVYTDPGRYGTLDGTWEQQYGTAPHPSGDAYDASDGDLVVVTHDHHYDSDGVERVAGEDATVLVYDAVDADRIADNGRDVADPESLPYDVRRVSEGDELTVAGVDVQVVPAYNEPDGPNAPDGEPLHPEGFGCGYVVTVDGVSCFWTGDSDVIDAHADLDVSLFVPSISQSFTMDRHAAADLAEDLEPDLVLPIHYNTFPDLESDSRAFAGDVASRGVPVVLDEN